MSELLARGAAVDSSTDNGANPRGTEGGDGPPRPHVASPPKPPPSVLAAEAAGRGERGARARLPGGGQPLAAVDDSEAAEGGPGPEVDEGGGAAKRARAAAWSTVIVVLGFHREIVDGAIVPTSLLLLRLEEARSLWVSRGSQDLLILSGFDSKGMGETEAATMQLAGGYGRAPPLLAT